MLLLFFTECYNNNYQKIQNKKDQRANKSELDVRARCILQVNYI